jgi:glycerol-3-phosphate dehydrogenase
MPTFSRDLGFIVSRALTDQYGFACQIKTKDADAMLDRGGRHIFVVPWQERTLVGVWHSVFNDSQDEIAVTEEELQGFIDEVNDAFPQFDLSLDDVSMILTGLTLFGEEGKTDAQSMSFGKRSLIIDHEKADHIEGLVTLIGVRATTARVVAEKTVDLVLAKLRMRGPSSRTSVVPIHGGQIDYFEDFLCQAIKQSPRGLRPPQIRALVRKYGSTYPQVLGYANGDPEWIESVGDSNVLKAEIIHAVREEMAQTLEDVVLRRTDLGVCGNPGQRALKTCAGLVAKELGWSSSRIHEEIKGAKTIFEKRGFLST